MAAEIKATVDAVELGDEGRAVVLSYSYDGGDGRSGPVPADFDPWTAKEVHSDMGSAAVAQWLAVQVILQLRADVEAGNGVAVLTALTAVAKHGLVLPDWLASAFIVRMIRLQRHEVGSLDEAFQHSPPTERTRATLADEKELVPEVSKRLVAAVRANPNRAIDNELFDEVGRIVGIRKTLCYDLYRKGVRDHGYQDLKKLKRFIKALKKSAEMKKSPVRPRPG